MTAEMLPSVRCISRMVATLIGHVEPFQLGVEDWDQYTERLEQYFIASEIAAENKVAMLLTVVGAKTYSLLRDLIAPTKPANQDVRGIGGCDQGSPQT